MDRSLVRGPEVGIVGSVEALPARPDGLRVGWQTVGLHAIRDGVGTVVLELVRRGFDEATRITCLTRDDGDFVIPAAALASLPDYGPDQTDHVVASRVVRRAFSARGLTNGEAIVMTRDAVRLR